MKLRLPKAGTPIWAVIWPNKIKFLTKAGIHAEVIGKHGEVPITAHIARDHNYNDVRFSEVKEKDVIRVRVIGVRFELNDPCIDVIGKVVEKRDAAIAPKRPLKIGGEYLENDIVERAIEDLGEYNEGDISSDDESYNF